MLYEVITMIITDTAPVKSEMLTFTELMDLTGLHPSILGELIEMGWISPLRTMSEAYLFKSRDVYRVRNRITSYNVCYTKLLRELCSGESGELVCDARNFEIILRMARAAARPVFEALPAARLQPYLAKRQGLWPRGEDADDLYERLERLSFYPMNASALEKRNNFV